MGKNDLIDFPKYFKAFKKFDDYFHFKSPSIVTLGTKLVKLYQRNIIKFSTILWRQNFVFEKFVILLTVMKQFNKKSNFTQSGCGVGRLSEKSSRESGVDGGQALVLDHARKDGERWGTFCAGREFHNLKRKNLQSSAFNISLINNHEASCSGKFYPTAMSVRRGRGQWGHLPLWI